LTDAPRLGSIVGAAEQAFSTIFTSAFEIGAPVLAALLITDVAFGVVSRVVPQMNIFAVGFPTKVAVAMLLVGASLPFVSGWISGQLSESVGAALGALHVA
jgi:flagellar biosynthetic protein FliR